MHSMSMKVCQQAIFPLNYCLAHLSIEEEEAVADRLIYGRTA